MVAHFKTQKERLDYLKGNFEEIILERVVKEEKEEKDEKKPKKEVANEKKPQKKAKSVKKNEKSK